MVDETELRERMAEKRARITTVDGEVLYLFSDDEDEATVQACLTDPFAMAKMELLLRDR